MVVKCKWKNHYQRSRRTCWCCLCCKKQLSKSD